MEFDFEGKFDILVCRTRNEDAVITAGIPFETSGCPGPDSKVMPAHAATRNQGRIRNSLRAQAGRHSTNSVELNQY
jgi:hypothetical protein